MKLLKLTAVLIVAFFLQGCFESGVSLSKKSEIVKGLTWEEALEKNADCATVNWSSFKDENGNEFAKAECTLKKELQEKVKINVDDFVNKKTDRSAEEITSQENDLNREISYIKDDVNKLTLAPSAIPSNDEDAKQRLASKLHARETELEALKEKKAHLPNFEQVKKLALDDINSSIGSPSVVQAIYIFSISEKTAKFSKLDVTLNGKQIAYPLEVFDVGVLTLYIGTKDQEKMSDWWIGKLSARLLGNIPVDLRL